MEFRNNSRVCDEAEQPLEEKTAGERAAHRNYRPGPKDNDGTQLTIFDNADLAGGRAGVADVLNIGHFVATT
jgi:hypothetical protein